MVTSIGSGRIQLCMASFIAYSFAMVFMTTPPALVVAGLSSTLQTQFAGVHDILRVQHLLDACERTEGVAPLAAHERCQLDTDPVMIVHHGAMIEGEIHTVAPDLVVQLHGLRGILGPVGDGKAAVEHGAPVVP